MADEWPVWAKSSTEQRLENRDLWDAPVIFTDRDGNVVPYRNPRRTDDPVADEDAGRGEDNYERTYLGWEGMEPA